MSDMITHDVSPNNDGADVREAQARALDDIAAERARVVAGPYGPHHDDEHGIGHLGRQVIYRLVPRQIPRDKHSFLPRFLYPWTRREVWVQVGQFAVAAIELIDREAAREAVSALGAREPDDREAARCYTCNGWNPVSGLPMRETVGMVCPTCGTDYSVQGAREGDRKTAEEA